MCVPVFSRCLSTFLPRLSFEVVEFFATVGLGVSDFGYRIFGTCFGMVSGMDSVHRHGHGKENQETVSHEERMNTASLHCNCSSIDSSLPDSLSSEHSCI